MNEKQLQKHEKDINDKNTEINEAKQAYNKLVNNKNVKKDVGAEIAAVKKPKATGVFNSSKSLNSLKSESQAKLGSYKVGTDEEGATIEVTFENLAQENDELNEAYNIASNAIEARRKKLKKNKDTKNAKAVTSTTEQYVNP